MSASSLVTTGPLVLASASPRRRELLHDAGIPIEVVPADVEEASAATPDDLADLVTSNAAVKAVWVAERHPGRICLGADTLVAIDGHALGKPRDPAEAEAMLHRLSGRTHEVCTGVCLCRADHDGTLREIRFHETTLVTFKPLAPATVKRYQSIVDTADKAGAYAIQEHGDLLVERIEGSWSNVVGLPVDRVLAELERFASP